MSVEFLRPWMLLFLLLLPGLVVAARGVRVLGRGRKPFVLFLRIVAFLLLVGAVAETQLLREGDVLSVMFVVDRSSSVPEAEWQFAETYLLNQAQRMTRKDRAGVIFFGKQAGIETPPRRKLYLEDFHTVVDAEGTDMARAVRLAMAAFPQESQKRIVLISDGNQTQGSVEAEVRRARANGIEVSVLPLKYEYDNETTLENIIVPPRVRQAEPFNITVVINAQTGGPATLRLFRHGDPIVEQEVELEPGKNAFVIPQSLDQAGFYAYEAVVEPRFDTRGTNNRGESFVTIAGTGKVLYLEGQPEEGIYLSAALEAEGMPVEIRDPLGAPSSLEEYNAYDLIILSDADAADLSLDQQRMIQSAVRDFGVGLLMIGGDNSFGSGGYLGTPVEEALPVTMDVKQRKIIPSGALVMIMHTCELPQANYWAKKMSLAALETLSRHDYMGFLRYHRQLHESWLFPLERLGSKTKQRSLLQNLGPMDVGDMPNFNKTLEMAYDALMKCKVNVKHIVIMSDGDPSRPTAGIVTKIRDAGITISTVCFDTHNMPANVQVMNQLAAFAKGNAYVVKDSSRLPSIFIKEASHVRRSLIVEEPFTPVVVHPSEVIDGFDEGFPQLLGYVVTSVRPDSQLVFMSDKEDPILALRRYGLGKAAAFTSDAKRRWAQQWLTWDGYAKFWSQLVRWTIRDPGGQFLQVESRVDGQWAHVAIDAIDEEGRFLNGLDIKATAVDPQIQTLRFNFRQTAPGRYEGSFPVERAGTYLISVNVDGEEFQSNVSTGVSVPFSPELRSVKSNESLLHRIAELGGGRLLDAETTAFTHNLEAHTRRIPLWPQFLGLAIILFFLDICVRRLFFEVPQLRRAAERVVGWAFAPFRRVPVPVGPATEEMGQLMEAKSRAEALHGAPSPEPVDSSATKKEQLLAALDEASVEEPIHGPAAGRPRPPVSSIQETPEIPMEQVPASEYTGSLLEAKRRAQSRLREGRRESKE